MKMLMKLFIATFLLILLGLLNTKAQPFSSQAEWENYFKNKLDNLDPIEGIWSLSSNIKIFDNSNTLINSEFHEHLMTMVVYENSNEFFTYSLYTSEPVEIKFIKTAASNEYIIETFDDMSFTSSIKTTAILTNDMLINYSYIDKNKNNSFKLKEGSYIDFDNELLKIFPEEISNKNQSSSGTGFAISSNGIIATNYHVIEGARSIQVRGVNFNFDKYFNAKVLVFDKNNDLALIKIDDDNFKSLGTIPYTIKTDLEGAGMNIFVLGYPLRATMGDEIKLTNGIISSKTGFQGNTTLYQISAPVQPGNSGGPLFDKYANLIGIINAKHSGAENVSYAVKSRYLLSLIELLPNPPKLQSINLLTNKSLTDQVELVKKYVYIIETK
ncbi:MAG: serine protease [Bacteroidetes bacterium]|nr:serine protease [Bacteroidota bacterium]